MTSKRVVIPKHRGFDYRITIRAEDIENLSPEIRNRILVLRKGIKAKNKARQPFAIHRRRKQLGKHPNLVNSNKNDKYQSSEISYGLTAIKGMTKEELEKKYSQIGSNVIE